MISRNVSLKIYNTFGLDYKANYLLSLKTEEEAISVLYKRKSLKPPLFILGGGSNLLFLGNISGTLLYSEIKGIKIEESHPEYVIISAGSGIKWDSFVAWCVNKGFGGVENLSFIPGNVGASPVQNIGAYGVEVKDIIEKVRAVSISDGTITEFTNDDCRFSYRNSIFKEEQKGKYLITRVYYKLSTKPKFKLDYGSLISELQEPTQVTLKNVRQAVIDIRKSKLPDPDLIGNAGSFFKNPGVDYQVAEDLKKRYPDLPVFEDHPGRTKLAAGWLIDQCGWKGKRSGDAGVHDKQALVLVNHGNASGKDIYNLSLEIKESVKEKFGIELEREVELVGTI